MTFNEAMIAYECMTGSAQIRVSQPSRTIMIWSNCRLYNSVNLRIWYLGRKGKSHQERISPRETKVMFSPVGRR